MHWKLTDSGLFSVPDTYRNPADDVAMESTSAVDVSKYESEITMLRCDLIDKQTVMQEVLTAYDKAKAELADMTAQRDREVNGWDSTRLDSDRLDAQRYRDTRTIYCVSNGVPESDSDDQTDLYISVHKDLLAKATGGQP
jgi:hypothetical protein